MITGRREYELAGLAAVEARDSIVFGCLTVWRERWGDGGGGRKRCVGIGAVKAVRRANRGVYVRRGMI